MSLIIEFLILSPVVNYFTFHSVERSVLIPSLSFSRKVSAVPSPFWLFKHVQHCRRSTLLLYHCSNFRCCDLMPNLKTFCHVLRHKMASHLLTFLPSISKPALWLLDLILSNPLVPLSVPLLFSSLIDAENSK